MTQADTTHKRFYLSRLRLNSGGYDASGTYWGVGGRLYQFSSEDGEETGVCRVPGIDSREAAKAHVLKHWPNATFFN